MSLILHPDVEKLRSKLNDLIFEYENLTNQICPDLERNYILTFGLLEYEIYHLELEIDKIKHKIQLISIEINNEDEININLIDDKIKTEFLEYEEKIKGQLRDLEYLQNASFEKLSIEDFKKLKDNYRILIKKLHPDLNPNQTQFEKMMFIQATNAFHAGDLKQIESLVILTSEKKIIELSEIDNLKMLIKDFEDRISEVKNEYPYNKKELLLNKEDKQEYIDILNDLIKDRKEQLKEYENKINELI